MVVVSVARGIMLWTKTIKRYEKQTTRKRKAQLFTPNGDPSII